jgi:murein L,D-transpeptidase YcbB/YkuD
MPTTGVTIMCFAGVVHLLGCASAKDSTVATPKPATSSHLLPACTQGFAKAYRARLFARLPLEPHVRQALQARFANIAPRATRQKLIHRALVAAYLPHSKLRFMSLRGPTALANRVERFIGDHRLGREQPAPSGQPSAQPASLPTASSHVGFWKTPPLPPQATLQKIAQHSRSLEQMMTRVFALPRLAETLAQSRKALIARQRWVVEKELEIAQRLLNAAFEIGGVNRLSPLSPPPQAKPGQSDTQKKAAAEKHAIAIAARDSKQLASFLQAIRDEKSLEAQLKRLLPAHDQYRRLLALAKRYQKLVARGGWKKVRPSRRKTSRLKAQLVPRLASEGYLPHSVRTEQLDNDELDKLIERFRKDHALPLGGGLDRAFFRALNVPAKTRLAAIELNLARWKKSQLAAGSYHLFVNIPSYRLELWKNQKRLAIHRVVVGKRHGTRCDSETKRRIPAYATPTHAGAITHLVLSPFWNVTQQIKQRELDAEVAKDPQYYEKNGYELMKAGTLDEWVRQLPGPENALGFVKFIFPNKHAVFLHDTPQKRFFSREQRAFSHGCVRVESAQQLARRVLAETGTWKKARFETLYRKWAKMRFKPLRDQWDPDLYESLREKAYKLETRIDLKRSLPIELAYITVTVDESGRPTFYPDIYRRDKNRLLGKKPRRCIPEKTTARWLFKKLPEKLQAEEKRVNALGPAIFQAVMKVQNASAPLRRRNRWLVRQAKKLSRFSEQHANMLGVIRGRYQKLQQERAAAGTIKVRWRRAQTQQAIAISRLYSAMLAATAKTERNIKLIEKRFK